MYVDIVLNSDLRALHFDKKHYDTTYKTKYKNHRHYFQKESVKFGNGWKKDIYTN